MNIEQYNMNDAIDNLLCPTCAGVKFSIQYREQNDEVLPFVHVMIPRKTTIPPVRLVSLSLIRGSVTGRVNFRTRASTAASKTVRREV